MGHGWKIGKRDSGLVYGDVVVSESGAVGGLLSIERICKVLTSHMLTWVYERSSWGVLIWVVYRKLLIVPFMFALVPLLLFPSRFHCMFVCVSECMNILSVE